MIDYTLSQLHSLAEAAKISINILDKFKVNRSHIWTIEDCIGKPTAYGRLPDVIACTVLNFSECLYCMFVENPYGFLSVRRLDRIEKFDHIVK